MIARNDQDAELDRVVEPIQVDPLTLTLRQYAALEGFEEQRELAEAIARRGGSVPKSALSELFRGEPGFPKARRLVGDVLLSHLPAELREPALLRLIENSRRRAERVAMARDPGTEAL